MAWEFVVRTRLGTYLPLTFPASPHFESKNVLRALLGLKYFVVMPAGEKRDGGRGELGCTAASAGCWGRPWRRTQDVAATIYASFNLGEFLATRRRRCLRLTI